MKYLLTVLCLVMSGHIQSDVAMNFTITDSQVQKMMKVQRKNYNALIQPAGPYVHAVRHEKLLYLSGITAFGTAAENATIDKQALEIFKQIKLIAKSEGSGLENLVKVTVYATDLKNISLLRKTLFKIYQKNLPASTLVHVQSLFAKGLKIEVEAIIAI